jgi:hypothetical protein
LPLPPGVTQIGSSGSQLQPAGTSPLCTTNFGANLYEFSGVTWNALPLPPGVTQIGSGGSRLQSAGTLPLCTTNFGANLYELSGGTWSGLPLPPGVTQIGGGGSQMQPAGGNAFVTANFGANLYELINGTWVSRPLPPGVTQIGGSGSQMEPQTGLLTGGRAGANAISSTNFGANLFELRGGTWSAVPLPPGVTQIGGGGSQMQPAGTLPLCTTSFGANIYQLASTYTSAASVYGFGCGNPALGFFPTANPIIGSAAGALISNAPTPLAGVTMGWSDSQLGGVPLLPLSLAFIGMPGCQLWHSNDVFGLPVTPLTATTLQFNFPIPLQGSLLGVNVYLQAYCFAPGENPLQIVASNGIDWLIGNQ